MNYKNQEETVVFSFEDYKKKCLKIIILLFLVEKRVFLGEEKF